MRPVRVRDEDGRLVQPCEVQQYRLVSWDGYRERDVWLDRTGIRLGSNVRVQESGEWWRVHITYGWQRTYSDTQAPWHVCEVVEAP